MPTIAIGSAGLGTGEPSPESKLCHGFELPSELEADEEILCGAIAR